jgi:hypothetical protein
MVGNSLEVFNFNQLFLKLNQFIVNAMRCKWPMDDKLLMVTMYCDMWSSALIHLNCEQVRI